jgi:anhydro-N-acetylmuramic acid kinase
MSGTSVDGIDAALCRIDGHAREATVDLLAFRTTPYPAEIRQDLLHLYDDQTAAVQRMSSLNMVVGGLFGDAVLAICAEGGVASGDLRVIGSHGQTVWHQPHPDPALPYSTRSTIQSGAPAAIAARTSAPVMADFRLADIAVGGQGAPLAPYFDWALQGDASKHRVILNLGGIGNLTWLPAGGDAGDVIAFDTGPGNMLIDGLVVALTGGAAQYDADGAIAAAGYVDRGLLGHLMEDPYLTARPPKSTGREYYSAREVELIMANADLRPGDLGGDDGARQRAASVIATATAFTAESVAHALRTHLPAMPDQVIVNGGGARNPTLMRMLAEALPGVEVMPSDATGIDADAKEAMLFALLAHDGLAGLPTNIPSATGASRAVTLGSLTRL